MQLHIYTGSDAVLGKTLSVILSMRALHQNGQPILVLDMLDPFDHKLYNVFKEASEKDKRINSSKYDVYTVNGAANLRICTGKDLRLRSMSQVFEAINDAIETVSEIQKPVYVLVDTNFSIVDFAGLDCDLTFPNDLNKFRLWINWDLRGLATDSLCRNFWKGHDYLQKATPENFDPHDPFVHVFGPRSWTDERNWLSIDGFLSRLLGYRDLKNWIFNVPPGVNWRNASTIVPNNQSTSFGAYLRDHVLNAANVTPDHKGELVADYWRNQEWKKPLNTVFVPFDREVIDFRNRWTSKALYIHGMGGLDNRLSTIKECKNLNFHLQEIFHN